MKTPYRTLYEVLTLNRIVVLTITLCCLGSSLFFGWMLYTLYQQTHNGTFAVSTDGSILPLQWMAQKDNLEVETLAHLEQFHSHFYGMNSSNYENQLEKALWLGDSSVDQLYRQKKAEGVYNRLLQFSLVQKVTAIQSEVNLSVSPYTFETITHFEIDRGSTVDRYELVSSGKLVPVDRHFPNNAHGLLITEYFENSLKLVQDEH